MEVCKVDGVDLEESALSVETWTSLFDTVEWAFYFCKYASGQVFFVHYQLWSLVWPDIVSRLRTCFIAPASGLAGLRPAATSQDPRYERCLGKDLVQRPSPPGCVETSSLRSLQQAKPSQAVATAPSDVILRSDQHFEERSWIRRRCLHCGAP